VDLCSFLTIGLMLGAVTPCTADTPRNEIEAALVTFATAFNKGDGAAVAAHYVEDAAVLRSQHVTTEGDRLYVEVRGEGTPLLMIPGNLPWFHDQAERSKLDLEIGK
jgi:hypothetical protein